ncbi:hypothetical protein Bca52824_049004 [Brassica carinata]|uniref:Pyruvate dehydrogenase E1 component subunit beta n=1 Tax=Brassica carinata TaxID=52824 RepID=A0A8X7RJK2_BRACI|nr:hypothetical protein Bca52824_049004 [Brassica carinata]
MYENGRDRSEFDGSHKRENFHGYLDAPVMCLSSQEVPTPYAGTLEEWTVVQPAQIATAVEQLCQ